MSDSERRATMREASCIWCPAPATESVDLLFALMPACHTCHQRHLARMQQLRQDEAARLAKRRAAAIRGWERRRQRAAAAVESEASE